MFKAHFSFGSFVRQCTGLTIQNGNLCIHNFIDTLSCNACPRKHNRHHGDHQKGHDDLHGILHKCHHISNLHGSVIHCMSSVVDDQNGNTIHDQHHSRHHKCHTAVDKQVGLCQSVIGILKTRLLVFLTAERPDDRNTGQYLP